MTNFQIPEKWCGRIFVWFGWQFRDLPWDFYSWNDMSFMKTLSLPPNPNEYLPSPVLRSWWQPEIPGGQPPFGCIPKARKLWDKQPFSQLVSHAGFRTNHQQYHLTSQDRYCFWAAINGGKPMQLVDVKKRGSTASNLFDMLKTSRWLDSYMCHYPSSHNHGSVENGCTVSPIGSFPLSFRVSIFHWTMIMGERFFQNEWQLFRRTSPDSNKVMICNSSSWNSSASHKNPRLYSFMISFSHFHKFSPCVPHVFPRHVLIPFSFKKVAMSATALWAWDALPTKNAPCFRIWDVRVYMGVSENGGTPKSSISIGISIINHAFWGTPIFGNTHIHNLIIRYTIVSFRSPL